MVDPATKLGRRVLEQDSGPLRIETYGSPIARSSDAAEEL